MERSSPDLELYTIPSYSSWFSWSNIHEVERLSLREFFDATSITRSPRIYKEYRDFIIAKFREDPSRKLTFTEVRKSLVGDISVLHKVFTFLEKWGLINFIVSENGEKNDSDGSAKEPSVGGEEVENWRGRVKVEEGAPYGVRVVAAPNSMKPIISPPQPPSMVALDGGGVVGEIGESGFKWPPLASYSDVYGELMQEEKKKGLQCGSCKDNCESKHYEYTKEESLILCQKCFNNGNFENAKSPDDFKLNESKVQGAVWTEAETLLLLESVLKHGDDWDLVAQNVQTKSKFDCISKLMQLPFGDLMLGTGQRSKSFDVSGDNNNNSKQDELLSDESQKTEKAEDSGHEHSNKDNEHANEGQQNGDEDNENPPPKRMRTGPNLDASSSLMKQVARIAVMLGPEVEASATEAAITGLCYENQCPREIFDDGNFFDPEESPDQKRADEIDDAVEEERPNPTEVRETSHLNSVIPLNLKMRAATATALGAAAANAKLLADKEERDIGRLLTAMIEAQLKKLRRKMKYFEDLERIMEKEHIQLEELEESLVAERFSVLQKVINAGITKSREHVTLKHPTDTVQ